MVLAYSFFVGLFVTVFAIAILGRVAGRLGILDHPGPRKIHATAIPRVGGIAIAVSAVATIFLWLPLTEHFIAFVAGAIVIVAVGIWDDIANLDYKRKLIGQCAAIAILLTGGVHFSLLPFWGLDSVSKFISYPVTFLFLLGVTNAFNLFDGLDGLAGGCIGLSIAAIAFLAILSGDTQVPIICFSLVGAILGFLRFNTYPAIIFMGDAGSQFLGFTAGFLSIYLVTQVTPAINPAFPLLVLGLPLLDTVSVIVRRLLQKRSPFKGDKQHLHHRLLNRGLSHAQTVSILYALQILVVLTAYFSRFQHDMVVFGLFVFFGLAIFGPLYWMERVGLAFQAAHRQRTADPSGRRVIRAVAYLTKHGHLVSVLLLSVFLLLGAALAKAASRDIAILCLLVALISVLGIIFIKARRLFFFRLCAYCSCAVICFLLIRGGPNASIWENWQVNLFLAGLGGLVILCISFTRAEGFQLSPQDLLMMILVVTVPNLDVVRYFDFPLGTFLLQVSLLFYAVEFVLVAPGRFTMFVPVAATGALLTVSTISYL